VTIKHDYGQAPLNKYVDLGDIDTEETEPIKIEAKSSGIWWLTRSMKKGEETKEVKEAYLPASPVRPTYTKAKSEPGVVSKQDPLKPRSNSTDSKASCILVLHSLTSMFLHSF
jgi:hypothetical protein